MSLTFLVGCSTEIDLGQDQKYWNYSMSMPMVTSLTEHERVEDESEELHHHFESSAELRKSLDLLLNQMIILVSQDEAIEPCFESAASRVFVEGIRGPPHQRVW